MVTEELDIQPIVTSFQLPLPVTNYHDLAPLARSNMGMTIGYRVLRHLVRNDAMRDDPPKVYNWRIFAVAAGATFGGALFGIDSGIIGGVLAMPTFKAQYGLDVLSDSARAVLSGNLVITMQAGAILGALCGYPSGETVGRRPSLLVYSVLAFIGGLLQTFAYGHLACFYIGRFVEGLGLGGATMLGPMYVSENAPRHPRPLGRLLSAAASHRKHGRAMHMVPLALQAVPALFLFLAVLACPESPRWLASKDNWEAVGRVLSYMRQLPVDHPYVQHEVESCSCSSKMTVPELGLEPTNAINYYSPTIFAALGLSSSASGLFATGIYGVVRVTTCALYIALLADTMGRHWSFVWTGFGCAATLLYIGFYVRFDPPQAGGSISAAGYVALVCIYLFAAIFEFGWGPIAWVYINEIPTNRLRGYTVALAAATQYLWGLVVTKVGPIMLVNIPYGTYFVFGSFCVVWGVLAFWIPETKGVSLERMDELFGAADFSAIGDFKDATATKEADSMAATHHD
ncbi:hypothetical protein SCUCBS95973_008666 [Sporothrix curviconia]|uniref:Major facilitator superfamily (MFS) profile domain-containing protein n=1 Tax=Sporothrix curviconia TaxID=1260050 RepID=A0ABP0CP26_9PEZI